jgi:hypothetical protein
MITKQSAIIIAVAAIAVAGTLWIGRIVAEERGVDYLTEAFAAIAESTSADVSMVIESDVDAAALLGGGSTDAHAYVPISMRGAVAISYGDGSPVVGTGTWNVTDQDIDNVAMTAETRLDATGRVFMKVDGLPAPEEGDGAPVDVSALNGQWFTIGPDMLLSMTSWAERDSVADAVIAPRDASALRRTLREYPPFVRIGKVEDSVIDGRKVAHYVLRPDQRGLTDAIVAFAELAGGKPLSEKERAAIVTQTAERQYLVDVLVDKRTRRISLVQAIIIPGESEENARPVNITIKINDLDVPVAAEVPEGARPLKNLLAAMLAGKR